MTWAGCGQRNSNELGSVHLASGVVGLSGGELDAPGNSAAANAKVSIPANVLDGDNTITIDINSKAIVSDNGSNIGPVIQIGPEDLSLKGKVTITIPYQGKPDARRMIVYAKHGDATTIVKPVDLRIDATLKTLTLQFQSFGQFQCGMGPPPPTCAPNDCGPAPGIPNWICEDGTPGGPTGQCIADPNGKCVWDINWCPGACSPSDCGAMPNLAIKCADGSVAVPVCNRLQNGQCGWDIHCGGCVPPPVPGSNGGSSGGTMCDPSDPTKCGGSGSGGSTGGGSGGTMCDPTDPTKCPPPPQPVPPVCTANCNDPSQACPPGTVCDSTSGSCIPDKTQCGATTCGMGEYCCSPECGGGTCAPVGAPCPAVSCPVCGGPNGTTMCPPDTKCDPTTGRCIPAMGVPCGPNTCSAGEICCSDTCGICAPMGAVCPAIACEKCGANGQTCPPGQVCDAAGQCVTSCQPSDCGPPPPVPNYMCQDGSTGGPTGQCVPAAQSMTPPTPAGGPACMPGQACPPPTTPPPQPPMCIWEIKWCPRACDPTVDCGPQPVTNNPMCPPGTSSAVCERAPDGTCYWSLECK
jgi:hypothetical protein